MSNQTELLREAVALIRGVRDEIKCLPQSYGYDVGVLPEIAAFLAKIDAMPAGEVPEGFVMVPAHPSNAMLDAGFDAQPEAGRDSLLCAWGAMLAASGRQDGAR